jgi:hypothetical protein
MASRSTKDRFANYVLLGASGLLLVAVGALAFALLRDRSLSTERADETPTTSAKTPTVKGATRADGGPSAFEAPTQQSPVSTRAEKPIVLRSDDLRQQYANNETGADQAYKNKLLEVTGTISVVYQESPLIGISFGQPQDPLPSILCEMDRQQLSLLSKLRRGQTVTVRGTGMGKIQGGFIGIGNGRLITNGM